MKDVELKRLKEIENITSHSFVTGRLTGNLFIGSGDPDDLYEYDYLSRSVSKVKLESEDKD